MDSLRIRVIAVATVGVAVAAYGLGALTVQYELIPYPFLRSAFGDEADLRSVETRSRPTAGLDALRALGYVASTFDPEAESVGVLDYVEGKAGDGLNLYHDRYEARALLIDMDGTVLHEWTGTPDDPWFHVELFDDGRLLVVRKDRGVRMIDVHSNVLWEVPIAAHHDVWTQDGKIWLNTRGQEVFPEIHPTRPIVDDRITVIGEDGSLIDEWSIARGLLNSEYRYLLPNLAGRDLDADLGTQARGADHGGALDVIHTNSVQVFDGSLAHLGDLFRAGNVLISMRELSSIAILDGATKRPIWLWGPGQLAFQHHAQLLPSGNILLFDNGWDQSRVLEVSPLDYSIAWQYTDEDFFTETRGSVQRLPGGNTLITESNTGWVFEVTPDGETVWTFANPAVDDQQMRTAIWRMQRFDRAAVQWLRGLTPPAP